MGTDCSMILPDDRHRRLKTKEERIDHITLLWLSLSLG